MKIIKASDMRRAGRTYIVTLKRPDGDVFLSVKKLSIAERERIDAEHQEPFPPRAFDAAGKPYLDYTDKGFVDGQIKTFLRRREARVAAALGSDFFGTDDRAEQVRLLREELDFSPEEIALLETQIRNPVEVTPEMVEAAEERLAPFAATDTGS